MASSHSSAPVPLPPAAPASVGESLLKPRRIRTKLILGAVLAALTVAVVARSVRGGTSRTGTASLNALSSQVGCLAVTNTEDLGFVQDGTCWFTPLPDHAITTEEMLQNSPSTQARLDAMKVVTLTVYTGSFGDMSAEEIANEKFEALINTQESCDGPTYYARGSNWFTDAISDVELARRIAMASRGEFGSRQCGGVPR
jgi:hypothetical protein